MMLLIYLLMVAGCVALFAAVFGHFKNDSRGLKSKMRENTKQLNIAKKALSSISAGAAMPVLEAQLALDEIHQSEMKELQ